MLGQAADAIRLRPSTATLRDIASEIEWRKVSMLSIDQYAALGRPVSGVDATQLVELMRGYEALKDDRRQLDFEDVLLACAGMLEAEPRVAASVHEQYRHFTVDEFQDVSPLQNRLLELWLGDRHDICVVGDASQTIYSFAGAEQRFLLEFERRYPDATVVRLETNYRSQPPILTAANALMRGRPGALELVPAREQFTADAPTITAYDTEGEEAAGIAAGISARIEAGTSPDEIAVLYRAHAQSAVLQQALAAEGIATTVLGGRGSSRCRRSARRSSPFALRPSPRLSRVSSPEWSACSASSDSRNSRPLPEERNGTGGRPGERFCGSRKKPVPTRTCAVSATP